MKELKPCPFCGGKAEYDNDIAGWESVSCTNSECDADLDTIMGCGDDIVKKWNHRAIEDEVMHDPKCELAAAKAEIAELVDFIASIKRNSTILDKFQILDENIDVLLAKHKGE